MMKKELTSMMKRKVHLRVFSFLFGPGYFEPTVQNQTISFLSQIWSNSVGNKQANPLAVRILRPTISVTVSKPLLYSAFETRLLVASSGPESL